MLSIPIKTADELARQRRAGELLASVFDMLDTFIQPGISTMAINNRVEDFIVNDLHSRPASKGQYDFPYVLNTSINEVVCHGMPKESEHLKSGMIVNVDITLEKRADCRFQQNVSDWRGCTRWPVGWCRKPRSDVERDQGCQAGRDAGRYRPCDQTYVEK